MRIKADGSKADASDCDYNNQFYSRVHVYAYACVIVCMYVCMCTGTSFIIDNYILEHLYWTKSPGEGT